MTKSPYQNSVDAKSLIDEANIKFAVDNDIDAGIAALEAAKIRIECMLEIGYRLKALYPNLKKKDDE